MINRSLSPFRIFSFISILEEDFVIMDFPVYHKTGINWEDDTDILFCLLRKKKKNFTVQNKLSTEALKPVG